MAFLVPLNTPEMMAETIPVAPVTVPVAKSPTAGCVPVVSKPLSMTVRYSSGSSEVIVADHPPTAVIVSPGVKVPAGALR